MLEIVVDAGHRDDARVFGSFIPALPGRLFEPVENAPDERRDERDARFCARNRLVKAEEQGQVAVDALFLENFRGTDALPRRRDLDEHALPRGTGGLVLTNEVPRLLDRLLGVEREPRVDLRRYAAGNDRQDAQPELDAEPIDRTLHDRLFAAVRP